jgi:hypothetical protein
LPSFASGKVLENSTDYSIQNTLRQALFLPTTREAKYKAKAAIDTFFTRAGDVVSRVRRPRSGHRADDIAFAGINVLLTIVWLWVASQIAREHRRGRCRRDHHLEPFDDRGWQHLIEIFEREATYTRVRRANAMHRRVERITSNDRRKQQHDVFQEAVAVFGRRASF